MNMILERLNPPRRIQIDKWLVGSVNRIMGATFNMFYEKGVQF